MSEAKITALEEAIGHHTRSLVAWEIRSRFTDDPTEQMHAEKFLLEGEIGLLQKIKEVGLGLCLISENKTIRAVAKQLCEGEITSYAADGNWEAVDLVATRLISKMQEKCDKLEELDRLKREI